MRSRLTVGLALGLLAGLAIASVGQSPETPVPQRPVVQEWEYKVTLIHASLDWQTNKRNSLAADGWEFVGVLHDDPGNARGGHPWSNVAFRRPKK